MTARSTMRALACAALAVAVLACSETVTDTGYEGTWHRGNDKNSSTILLWKAGTAWKFAWIAESVSGTWKIRCDDNSVCVETIEGRKVAEHVFRVWEDPGDGKLRLECSTQVIEPVSRQTRYLDVLEVAEGGTTLWSFTLERDGQRFEGDGRPRRSFRKVSDRTRLPASP